MSASKIATPAKSFAEDLDEVPLPARAAAGALRWPARGLLVALNFLPMIHVMAGVAVAVFPPWSWELRVGAAALALWMGPPLLAHGLLILSPLADGYHAVGGRVFWTWWITLQSQTVFSRLPFLEELLRLIPGAYSMWLRLWGARIGRLTYWAPGVEITDRSLLDVGNDVVVGGKARLGAHMLRRSPDGKLELIVGRIQLGDRVMVGAQSAIGPGARLDDDEVTHAFFLAPPFSHWRHGKRLRHATHETELTP